MDREGAVIPPSLHSTSGRSRVDSSGSLEAFLLVLDVDMDIEW